MGSPPERPATRTLPKGPTQSYLHTWVAQDLCLTLLHRTGAPHSAPHWGPLACLWVAGRGLWRRCAAPSGRAILGQPGAPRQGPLTGCRLLSRGRLAGGGESPLFILVYPACLLPLQRPTRSTKGHTAFKATPKSCLHAPVPEPEGLCPAMDLSEGPVT